MAAHLPQTERRSFLSSLEIYDHPFSRRQADWAAAAPGLDHPAGGRCKGTRLSLLPSSTLYIRYIDSWWWRHFRGDDSLQWVLAVPLSCGVPVRRLTLIGSRCSHPTLTGTLGPGHGFLFRQSGRDEARMMKSSTNESLGGAIKIARYGGCQIVTCCNGFT